MNYKVNNGIKPMANLNFMLKTLAKRRTMDYVQEEILLYDHLCRENEIHRKKFCKSYNY